MVYLLSTGTGPLAGPPDTYREFAELLQARGMNIDWKARKHGPGIFIVNKTPARNRQAKQPKDDASWMDEADRREYERRLQDSQQDRLREEEWLEMFFILLENNEMRGEMSDWAIVVQCATAQKAKEAAGTTKHGFSWGRFLISGDPEVVKEIRRRL
jgi:hypothetical protein